MKLYTEEQVRKAIELARDTHPEGRGYMQREEYDYSMDEIFDKLTPTQLPSDEEIDRELESHKQSSVEFFLYEMFSLLGEFENKALPSYKIMDLFEQAKAMHKEEVESTYDDAIMKGRHEDGVEYYKEKFGGNK